MLPPPASVPPPIRHEWPFALYFLGGKPPLKLPQSKYYQWNVGLFWKVHGLAVLGWAEIHPPHPVHPPAPEKLVRTRAAPSCGAPTPQAAALLRCLVGYRFSHGRFGDGAKFLLFPRGQAPATLPRLGLRFRGQ